MGSTKAHVLYFFGLGSWSILPPHHAFIDIAMAAIWGLIAYVEYGRGSWLWFGLALFFCGIRLERALGPDKPSTSTVERSEQK